jgi:hypothetical protein
VKLGALCGLFGSFPRLQKEKQKTKDGRIYPRHFAHIHWLGGRIKVLDARAGRFVILLLHSGADNQLIRVG